MVGVLDTEQNKQIYEVSGLSGIKQPKIGNSKCMRFLALH